MSNNVFPTSDSLQTRLMARAVADRAIGSVPRPAFIPAAAPDEGERQQTFQNVAIPGTVTIPGGASYEVQGRGDFLYVISVRETVSQADAYSGLSIKDSNDNRYAVVAPHTLIRAPKNFSGLRFSNTGAFGITVAFTVGFGSYRTDAPVVGAVAYGGQIVDQFTRPNNVTAYAAGQVVSTLSASNRNLVGIGLATNSWLRVRKATLSKSGTSTTNANFTFYAGPTNTQADQTAASLNELFSVFNFTSMVGLSTGAKATLDDLDFWTRIGASASFSPCVCGTLVANAAYTPVANEQFTITLVGELIRDVPSSFAVTVNVN